MFLPRQVCVSVLLAAPLSAVAAEEPTLDTVTVTASPAADGYQPGRSSVAGREQDVLDIPRAVQQVGAQQIRDKQAQSLAEVVSSVSGVQESNTLAGLQDSFTRRGFGERNDGSVLRDGARSFLMKNFDATTESVEVLKGPASLLYGIQEPGGVINVVSKKPQFTPQGSVSVQASSVGGSSSTLDLTGPLGEGNLAYRLVAEYQDNDYWRNFGSIRRSMVAPSLLWDDGDNRLLLAYQYTDFLQPWDRGTVFSGGQAINVARETRLGDLLDQAEGTTQSASAVYTRQLDARWQWKTQLAWSDIQYSNYETRVTAFNASTGVLTRRLDGNVVHNRQAGLSSQLGGELALWGQAHRLTAGIDLSRSLEARENTYRGSASSQTQLNAYAPVYGRVSLANTTLSNSVSDNRSQIDSAALLLMDDWALTPRLSSSLGVRYQHYRQEDGVGRPYAVSTRASGSTSLPQLAMLYKLTPSLSAYGSYSESFEPNAASDGTSFAPETGKAYELGLKWGGSGLAATLALFDMHKRNVLVTENSVSSAVGKVRSQGVELDVSGALSRRLSAALALAYTDAVVKEDAAAYVGKQLYNVARHSGSASLAYDLGVDGFGNAWRTGGGVRYVGERQGDRANSFTLPAYTVADLFVGWQTRLQGRKLDIQANLKNVFDKTYYTSTAGSNLTVRVGDPRELLVKASLAF